MVGAKEFAINRKVIARRKSNPLIEKIRMPAFMRAHEKELKSMPMDEAVPPARGLPNLPEKDKSVEDNHFAPIMAKPWDAKTINPILEEARKAATTSRFPFFNKPKEQPKQKQAEKPDEDISDELANRITYKVLKNIKSYLSREKEQPMSTKHIKLEISL